MRALAPRREMKSTARRDRTDQIEVKLRRFRFTHRCVFENTKPKSGTIDESWLDTDINGGGLVEFYFRNYASHRI
jgi:hypothetical protein